MKIKLENTGRRFNREWIFRNVTLDFNRGERIAVLGSNGSGKSTFLQMLSGFLQPSEGKIFFEKKGMNIPVESLYHHISFCSPFLELYEELTAEECFRFHAGIKQMRAGNNWNEFSKILQLRNTEGKQLRFYSSGMRQRVKLALALLSESDIIFLDEPCSNLDAEAIMWYKNLVETYCQDRLLFVSSNNQPEEIFFCEREIRMLEMKS